MKYRTNFNLLCDVNDFRAARDYLVEDDMTEYLLHYSDVEEKALEKVRHIEWVLTDTDKGYIELITSAYLTKKQLAQISDWVRGQNSDGLGENFEQQDFAFYNACAGEYCEFYNEDEDEWYEEEDENWVMASFDWSTNEYLFELWED